MKARDNPYRVEKLHTLKFRFQDDNWETFLSRLATANYRGAIIGLHGSGKTTLTLELVERLEALGHSVNYLRINSEVRSQAALLVEKWLSTANVEQILVLDGAEQLRFFAWRKLLRHTKPFKGFVITAHTLGKLPTLYQTHVDAELLTDIVKALHPERKFSQNQLQQLLISHHHNLRECLRALYDDTLHV